MTKTISVVLNVEVDDDVAEQITENEDPVALETVTQAMRDLVGNGVGPVHGLLDLEILNSERAARVVRQEYFQTIIAEAEDIEEEIIERIRAGDPVVLDDEVNDRVDSIADNSTMYYGDQRTTMFATDNLEPYEEDYGAAPDFHLIAFEAYRRDLGSRVDMDRLESFAEGDEEDEDFE